MKIILKKEVPALGDEDTLVEVADGYARNYLLPQKLGVKATPKGIEALEKRRDEIEQKRAQKRVEFEELAKKLSEQELTIIAEAGEEEKLFGSVTSQDIVQAVLEATKIELDKKKIQMTEPIKMLGNYTIKAKLFQNVVAELKIKVIPK